MSETAKDQLIRVNRAAAKAEVWADVAEKKANSGACEQWKKERALGAAEKAKELNEIARIAGLGIKCEYDLN